jgi:hypothetical protein
MDVWRCAPKYSRKSLESALWDVDQLALRSLVYFTDLRTWHQATLYCMNSGIYQ